MNRCHVAVNKICLTLLTLPVAHLLLSANVANDSQCLWHRKSLMRESIKRLTSSKTFLIPCVQVLSDAAAIDAKASAGQSILPLCGLPLAVKDAIDVVGFPTTAATPALRCMLFEYRLSLSCFLHALNTPRLRDSIALHLLASLHR